MKTGTAAMFLALAVSTLPPPRKRRLPDLVMMQTTRRVGGSKRKGRNTSNLYFAKLLCALRGVV